MDEALLLADRVMVLDRGRIGFDLHVNLERPRRHSHPAFSTLRSRLLRELGVEDENADAPLPELAVGWNASARTKAPAAPDPKPDGTAWATTAEALIRS